MPIEKKHKNDSDSNMTRSFSENQTLEIKISGKGAETLKTVLSAEIAKRATAFLPGPDHALDAFKKLNDQIGQQMGKDTVVIEMDAFQLRMLRGLFEKKDPNGVKKKFIEIINQIEKHEDFQDEN
ncbi:MAG TPA: hypothetical protein VND15_01410 [Candidatus Acidoferrales bacterium]|nr:hypothetical protein [Candidatus Acidoferrales bacterium]